MAWLNDHHALIMAGATAAIAAFGALQIYFEWARRRDARVGARNHLVGPARSTRRALEALFRTAYDQLSAAALRDRVQESQLERLELKVLEIVRLASACGHAESTTAVRAFDQFLRFCDYLHNVDAIRPSVKDMSGFVAAYSQDERVSINVAAREALTALLEATNELANLAPRAKHEPALLQDRVPLLTPGSAIRFVTPNDVDSSDV